MLKPAAINKIIMLKILLITALILQTFPSFLITETNGLLTTSYLVEGDIIYATETTTGAEDNIVFLMGTPLSLFLAIWFALRLRPRLDASDILVFVIAKYIQLFLVINLIEVGSIADTVQIDMNIPLIAWLATQAIVLMLFFALIIMKLTNKATGEICTGKGGGIS